MVGRSTPKPPAKLAAAGRALWSAVTTMQRAGASIELRADELATLGLACRTADMVAALEADLEGEPLVVEGSKGQVAVHPIVAELRLQRGAMASLLRSLGIPDEASTWDNLTASQRARRAAGVRWSS